MKLTIALISMLAASTSADVLGRDFFCGDNKNCEQNCVDGRYHIVDKDKTSVYFGCSLGKPTLYANPDCSFGIVEKLETQKARRACDIVRGRLCARTYPLNAFGPKFINYCIIPSSDLGSFRTQCESARGTVTEHRNDLTYAESIGECSTFA
jgi:hypothetical protein